MKSRKEKLLKPDESKEGADNPFFALVARFPTRRFLLVGFVLLSIFFSDNFAFAKDLPSTVLVIPIEDTIDGGLSFFVQRMIRRAEAENIPLVLQINSNGGLVSAAQEIKDALLRAQIDTIAYVRGRALSAAALIAISCHRIFMEPGSELGAATPMMLMGSHVTAAKEKFVSAFKAEFRAVAESRKRPVAIAEAMVDVNHEGIDGVVKRGEIVTLTTEVAFEHGYCDQIVTSLEAAQRALKLESATLEFSKPTSAEVIARFFTSPGMSSLLFAVGFWLLIVEFFTPGFGVFGFSGIACMILFFAGHLFAHLAGLETVIMFVLGLLLLAAEIFIVPGFGMTGISGIALLFFSIVSLYGGLYQALYALASMGVYSIFIFLGLYYWGPKFSFIDSLVLHKKLDTDAGYVSADQNAFDSLLGLEGVSMSSCRPSGKAKIGDEYYDVVSDSDYIEKGAKILVRKVEGTKIFVRELTQ